MCGCFVLAYPNSSLNDWYHAALVPEIAPTTDILAIRDSIDGRTQPIMC
ncbi:hypothetical protein [Nitrosomonas communis]|nr:hypothetical protein [Nitrosomonas communis]